MAKTRWQPCLKRAGRLKISLLTHTHTRAPQNRYPRYHKTNVETPQQFSLFLYRGNASRSQQESKSKNNGGDLSETAAVNSSAPRDPAEPGVIESCTFERLFLAPGCTVERLSFKEHGLCATIFLPPGEGSHPGKLRCQYPEISVGPLSRLQVAPARLLGVLS